MTRYFISLGCTGRAFKGNLVEAEKLIENGNAYMIVFRSFTLSPQLLLKACSVRCLLRICFVGADRPLAHTKENTSELFQSLFTDFHSYQEQLNQPYTSCICTALSRANYS